MDVNVVLERAGNATAKAVVVTRAPIREETRETEGGARARSCSI